ncbi:hypothetical protein NESM_000348700 [Novymonas esmeraldas]|uniref:Uncharacterized protein n=1 Tax=Novymonas esmeraldas TaxID=1808958 RepID=A0AAW0EJN4_9TRYP
MLDSHASVAANAYTYADEVRFHRHLERLMEGHLRDLLHHEQHQRSHIAADAHRALATVLALHQRYCEYTELCARQRAAAADMESAQPPRLAQIYTAPSVDKVLPPSHAVERHRAASFEELAPTAATASATAALQEPYEELHSPTTASSANTLCEELADSSTAPSVRSVRESYEEREESAGTTANDAALQDAYEELEESAGTSARAAAMQEPYEELVPSSIAPSVHSVHDEPEERSAAPSVHSVHDEPVERSIAPSVRSVHDEPVHSSIAPSVHSVHDEPVERSAAPSVHSAHDEPVERSAAPSVHSAHDEPVERSAAPSVHSVHDEPVHSSIAPSVHSVHDEPVERSIAPSVHSVHDEPVHSSIAPSVHSVHDEPVHSSIAPSVHSVHDEPVHSSIAPSVHSVHDEPVERSTAPSVHSVHDEPVHSSIAPSVHSVHDEPVERSAAPSVHSAHGEPVHSSIAPSARSLRESYEELEESAGTTAKAAALQDPHEELEESAGTCARAAAMQEPYEELVPSSTTPSVRTVHDELVERSSGASVHTVRESYEELEESTGTTAEAAALQELQEGREPSSAAHSVRSVHEDVDEGRGACMRTTAKALAPQDSYGDVCESRVVSDASDVYDGGDLERSAETAAPAEDAADGEEEPEDVGTRDGADCHDSGRSSGGPGSRGDSVTRSESETVSGYRGGVPEVFVDEAGRVALVRALYPDFTLDDGDVSAGGVGEVFTEACGLRRAVVWSSEHLVMAPRWRRLLITCAPQMRELIVADVSATLECAPVCVRNVRLYAAGAEAATSGEGDAVYNTDEDVLCVTLDVVQEATVALHPLGGVQLLLDGCSFPYLQQWRRSREEMQRIGDGAAHDTRSSSPSVVAALLATMDGDAEVCAARGVALPLWAYTTHDAAAPPVLRPTLVRPRLPSVRVSYSPEWRNSNEGSLGSLPDAAPSQGAATGASLEATLMREVRMRQHPALLEAAPGQSPPQPLWPMQPLRSMPLQMATPSRIEEIMMQEQQNARHSIVSHTSATLSTVPTETLTMTSGRIEMAASPKVAAAMAGKPKPKGFFSFSRADK